MSGNGEIRTALFTCGKCGYRWRGRLEKEPIGCPMCRNYSLVGYPTHSVEIIRNEAEIKEE